jgi:hypothetical protein
LWFGESRFIDPKVMHILSRRQKVAHCVHDG